MAGHMYSCITKNEELISHCKDVLCISVLYLYFYCICQLCFLHVFLHVFLRVVRCFSKLVHGMLSLARHSLHGEVPGAPGGTAVFHGAASAADGRGVAAAEQSVTSGAGRGESVARG